MTRLVLFSLAALLALSPAPPQSQPPQQQPPLTLVLPLSPLSLDFRASAVNGFTISGVAKGTEGLDYSAGVSVTTPESLAILHRVILDRTHNQYFGYDLVVMRADDPGHVHLHFARLSDLRGFGFAADQFQPVGMDLPLDETAAFGDPVDVPLEHNARGGVLLHDRLTITPAPR